MNEAQSELVAVKLEDGWFMTLRKGDPFGGLMISEASARLINAAEGLLLACKVAHTVLKNCDCLAPDEESRLLSQSVLAHLEAALYLAEGGSE